MLNLISLSSFELCCGQIYNTHTHTHIHTYTQTFSRKRIWGVSRQLSQRAAREPQIVLFLTHVYDTKMYLKNCLINVFDVFFPQLSNDVSSFSKIFRFHLQKVQNMLYLKKCIFNIFFDPLNRKLSIFYVGKDIFQRVPKMFFARNRMRKSFWRWKWKISKKLPALLESWEKNTHFSLRLVDEFSWDKKRMIWLIWFFEYTMINNCWIKTWSSTAYRIYLLLLSKNSDHGYYFKWCAENFKNYVIHLIFYLFKL